MYVSRFAFLIFACSLLTSIPGIAQTLTVPVNLRYQVIGQFLDQEFFTGVEQRVEVFNDGRNCNVLALDEPRVAGTASGHVQLRTRLTSRGGTPVGTRCIPLFQWSGTLDSTLAPYVSADGTRLGFEIMHSSLEKGGDTKTAVPGVLWDWVKAYVHPELERIAIDLNPVLAATTALLNTTVPGNEQQINRVVDSVAFAAVSGDEEKLQMDLRLELPAFDPSGTGLSTAVLTAAEVESWDANWQAWDSFATWLIKELNAQLGGDDPGLTEALADSLLEARYDLRRALIEKNPENDPVRGLFVKTWTRLTPVLQQLQVSGEFEALKIFTFVSAVDALVAVDAVADSMAVKFDSATFRGLARLINQSVTDEQLQYTTAVDPELRRLLGLDPYFGEEPDSLEKLWSEPLSWLIQPVHAAPVDDKLVSKLTGWVPARAELDSYLTAVHLLLNGILDHERDKAKVPPAYLDIYDNLVLATAWQESCWRQYEKRNGRVTPLKSSAGSVGLMQVNQHVWRGVYDPEKLVDDIAYNARAGNEILVHYLVDYAIRKKEHEITGDKHSLAKATYAIYNGGPGHLTRYRRETSAYLEKIDQAFWRKYQAIQADGIGAVKVCYGG